MATIYISPQPFQNRNKQGVILRLVAWIGRLGGLFKRTLSRSKKVSEVGDIQSISHITGWAATYFDEEKKEWVVNKWFPTKRQIPPNASYVKGARMYVHKSK